MSAHEPSRGTAEWPELPPPTAGTASASLDEPAIRLSASLPYIAAVVAGIGLVLIIGLVFVAKPMATSAKAEAAPVEEAKAKTKAKAKARKGGGFLTIRKPAQAELSRANTAVLVLNGSGASGAATEAAATLRGLNYPIVAAGNAEHPDYQRTLVLYRAGFRGEAERLARDLGFTRKRVAQLDGMKRAELGQARVVLILGG